MFSSLPPTTVLAFYFLSRGDFGPFFRRRVASNCAYPRYYQKTLSAFYHGTVQDTKQENEQQEKAGLDLPGTIDKKCGSRCTEVSVL